MILYIAKFFLCSGLFIGAYYLFLEKEKVHRFKRWYLLLTLICSLVIPLITIELDSQSLPEPTPYLNDLVNVSETINGAQIENLNAAEPESLVTGQTFAIVIYASVASFLLFRISNGFFNMLSSISGKRILKYRGAFIISDNTIRVPFTFLNYIVLNEKDASNQQILMHELTHTRQKHTLDILFVEVVHCLTWLNPLLFLYKRAIRLNHEFLADEKVVKNHPVHEYQKLLLQKSKLNLQPALTSSLNYSITKKRFIMMSKVNNPTRSTIKMIFSTIMVCGAAILFSEKVYAQDEQHPPTVVQDTARLTATNEFDSLISKYIRSGATKTGKTETWFNITGITDAEKSRMRELYKKMTAEEKAKYPANAYQIFMTLFPAPKKNPPSAEDMLAFADPAVYGIWVDGKRIDNAELKNYPRTDFTHVFKSRLLKNSAHYGQYTYHLDLMTQEYFDKTYPPGFN